jgi:hypothetical protein
MSSASARALGIHVDTGTSTIVVQVDGPVDQLLMRRIHAAIAPLLAAHAAQVELDIAGDRRILNVA